MQIVAVQTGLTADSVMGGGVSDREFLTRLAKRGVHIQLLVPDGVPHLDHPNFSVHFYGHCLRHIPLLRYHLRHIDVFLLLRHLLGQLREVDWVRFNSPYRNGWGAWAGNRGRALLWGNCHHFEDRAWWKLTDRWLPPRCDLVTVVSESSRGDLLARCPSVNPANVEVIYNGIDAEQFHADPETRAEIRGQLGVKENEVLITFVGRLIPRKGIEELVETWCGLRQAPEARLLVIGGGDAGYPELSRVIRHLAAHDQRVTYRERVGEIASFLQASDIFLFPSRLEGFGLAVGEAMACELPVVTTHAKGVSEVVDSRCAFQSPIGDVEGFKSQLLTLVRSSAKRLAMGAAGRSRVLRLFDWDVQVDRLLACLLRKCRP